MILDLHGYRIHDAWKYFNEYVDTVYYKKYKSIKIITGKGQMLIEFPHWAQENKKVKSVSLNKDGGSFTVKIRL